MCDIRLGQKGNESYLHFHYLRKGRAEREYLISEQESWSHYNNFQLRFTFISYTSGSLHRHKGLQWWGEEMKARAEAEREGDHRQAWRHGERGWESETEEMGEWCI